MISRCCSFQNYTHLENTQNVTWNWFCGRGSFVPKTVSREYWKQGLRLEVQDLLFISKDAEPLKFLPKVDGGSCARTGWSRCYTHYVIHKKVQRLMEVHVPELAEATARHVMSYTKRYKGWWRFLCQNSPKPLRDTLCHTQKGTKVDGGLCARTRWSHW